MFNNLIESSSHSGELRRRGSFLLFTIAGYVLLLVVAGVASIYAYDARLEDQSLVIVTMMPLVDLPTVDRTVPNRPPSTSRNTNERRTFDERRVPMLSVDRPELPPTHISTKPNPEPPMRDGVTTLITGRNVDGLDGGRIGPGRTGVGTTPPAIAIEAGTPPPVPVVPKPKPIVVSKGPINGEAIALPKPLYPSSARAMGVQGKVNIQVLIDEKGTVVSAKAIDGHPLLKQVSERAAYQARFSPTLLGDQPVKVSGVITYNFVMQ